MALPPAEREAFLAEPHVGAVAVTTGDRAPLVVPIWYLYEPGGDLRIITTRDSRKARLIEKAGRFSLLAQRVTPNPRYVSVEGPVVAFRDATEEMEAEMAHRYLAEDAAAAYLEVSKSFGPQVAIDMRPEHWLSADIPAF